nr:hypothetical protein [Tanacetum cinerariifolium]
HILGVGRVLPGQGTVIPPPSQSTHSADIARLKKREKLLTKQVNMFMRMRTIVRGCGVNIDLYLVDNGSFMTSSYLGSRVTCRPGKPFIVALNCLTETMWARRCRPGRFPIRAFPFDVSRATCRPVNPSLATSHPGFLEIVAGENGNCCSVCRAREMVWSQLHRPWDGFDCAYAEVMLCFWVAGIVRSLDGFGRGCEEVIRVLYGESQVFCLSMVDVANVDEYAIFIRFGESELYVTMLDIRFMIFLFDRVYWSSSQCSVDDRDKDVYAKEDDVY